MITRNFKNCLAMALSASSTVYGTLPATNTSGQTYYLTGQFSFPGSVTQSIASSATAEGISVGTGNTAATELDYALESPITSGITLAISSTTISVDDTGHPYVQYRITATNTSSESITISEIGYKQKLIGTKKPGGTSSSNYPFLLDRTVLSVPLTLPAGDAGVIVYRLSTNPTPERTVSGVKMVSFTWGSDSDVAAMIDAARAGNIDLQADGGWAVGDMRIITVGAFTGGNNVACPEQQITIAITQFGDYNSCGCMFQFDFIDCLSASFRMSASATNAGGYGTSEMYTTTLPALVDAMPSWLQSRLKTFNVLASAGNNSATIETVENNKLALRSEIEVFGTLSYSKAGEGSWIPYYSSAAVRSKTLGISGSSAYWWQRSPYSSYDFCSVTSPGNASIYGAHTTYGVAPFGCI